MNSSRILRTCVHPASPNVENLYHTVRKTVSGFSLINVYTSHICQILSLTSIQLFSFYLRIRASSWAALLQMLGPSWSLPWQQQLYPLLPSFCDYSQNIGQKNRESKLMIIGLCLPHYPSGCTCPSRSGVGASKTFFWWLSTEYS